MEELGALLVLMMRFQSGWHAQDINTELHTRDAGVVDQGRLVHTIDLAPFDRVTFEFQGPEGGLRALKLKTVWKCDWATFAAREADLRTLLRGLVLMEVGQRPFSFATARTRLENRGTSRTAAGVMFEGSRPEGKLIGHLKAAKAPDGSPLYGIELTWLPAKR